MIRISIVDDEEIIREKISALVSETLAAEPVEAEIRTYPDGERFLGAPGTDMPSDILLADIQMAGMDGMELGRKIRRDNPGMYIIWTEWSWAGRSAGTIRECILFSSHPMSNMQRRVTGSRLISTF